MIVGDSIEGRKMISVKKMKKLLADLLDTDYLCAQTMAETGNIAAYHSPEDRMCHTTIDVKHERINSYQTGTSESYTRTDHKKQFD